MRWIIWALGVLLVIAALSAVQAFVLGALLWGWLNVPFWILWVLCVVFDLGGVWLVRDEG